MYMWMKWNWNILMFLCQPIFLNLRHIFEDFLLTALIKKSEYDSKLTKNNILWNIQFLLRKRRGLFSELAYQYFCQICSNDHTSELGNSPTFPLFIIIIVQFSSFEKYHSHHSQVRSLFVIDDLLLLLRQQWRDSGWLRGRYQPTLRLYSNADASADM